MRLRIFTIVLPILFALTQISLNSVHAQDIDAPLLLVFDGDIWSWAGPDSDLENLTHSGGVIVAALSPDNTQVAYAEVPTLVREAYAAQGWAGLIPHDIRVLDLATGENTLIAGQPDDIQVMDYGGVDPYIDRTFPVWSPDGTMLAWTDSYDDAEHEYHLMLRAYSLAEQQVILSHEILNLELPTQVQWGTPGIVLQNVILDEEAGLIDAILFQVVDVEGHVVADTPAPGFLNDTYRWVHAAQVEYLYLPISGIDNETKLFDPASGELTVPPGTFELYALSAPEGASLRGESGNMNELALMSGMEIVFPGRAPLTPADNQYGFTIDLQYSYLAFTAAISPDGHSVAYVHDDTVTIVHDGESIETGIELPQGSPQQLLWSALAWRIPLEK